MNQDSKKDLWLADHLNKCRCCFEKFDHIEKQVEITEIEEQFLELTKVEVTIINNISTYKFLTFQINYPAQIISELFQQSLYEMHK